MSDVSTWMPMYWADYRAKTHHLTLEEHGAYCLLLCEYWERGTALQDDNKRLALSIGASPTQWRRLRPIIEPFFRIIDGAWTHERVEEEIAEARLNVERNKKRTEAATKAARDKRNGIRNGQRDVERTDVPRGGEGEGPLPREGYQDLGDGVDPDWEVGQ